MLHKFMIKNREHNLETKYLYESKNTAFIFVEDAKCIFNLTCKIIPQGRRPVTINKKSLFIVTPINMTSLPNWIDIEPSYNPYKNDTHIIRKLKQTKKQIGLIFNENTPVIIQYKNEEWLYSTETQTYFQSHFMLISFGYNKIIPIE